MIALHVTGGIGNQMFIVARGESWRSQGYNIVYPNVDFAFDYLEKNFDWTKHAREYKTIFKNFNWDEYKANVSLKQKRLYQMYSDFIPQDGIEYVGYFQSEKNFVDKDFIKWLFEPSDRVKDLMAKYNDLFRGVTCSIHVRRGNYLHTNGKHPVQPLSYYTSAQKTLEPFKIDKYFVFSDDINWCKDNFRGNKLIYIKDKDYVELFLMSKCTHHIIANSAFSWWGSWLGETDDSVIIAPEHWFGDELSSEHIIPQRWIRL
jgi:hypothetical protein